jgi:hypothetical protein
MIFDLNGTPLQGITGGYAGDRRVEYIIPPSARKAGEHEIVIESSCNGMFGMAGGGIGPPDVRVVSFRVCVLGYISRGMFLFISRYLCGFTIYYTHVPFSTLFFVFLSFFAFLSLLFFLFGAFFLPPSSPRSKLIQIKNK